jgi:aldose 1-epimerase
LRQFVKDPEEYPSDRKGSFQMPADLLQLELGNSKALLSPRGSAIVALTLNGAEVIPMPAMPLHPYHGVLLAPWPNRIAKGQYSFQDKTFLPAINEVFGNALHGLLFATEANIISQTENKLKLSNQIEASESYPWNLTVELFFELSEAGLRVETTATNNSETASPVALGTHPFFVFDEESRLEVRARKASVHGKDMIPISEIPSSEIGFGLGSEQALEGLALDVQFTEIEPTCAVLKTRDWNLEIWQERAEYLMIYTTQEFNWADGRKRAVAIEPQTAAADAFNNGQGLRVLEPGESFSYLWGARLG